MHIYAEKSARGIGAGIGRYHVHLHYKMPPYWHLWVSERKAVELDLGWLMILLNWH